MTTAKLGTGLLALMLGVGLMAANSAIAKEGEGHTCPAGGKTCAAGKTEKTADGKTLAACDHAHEEGEHAHASLAGAPRVGVQLEDSFYPVSTCAVTGETLAPDHIHLFEHEGRQVATCCAGCETKFTADPATYIANLDAMILEQQDAAYPLTECPIAGSKIGASAKSFIVGNYLVKVCCAGCEGKVKANPEETLTKLAAYWAEVPAVDAEIGEAVEVEKVEVANAE